MIVQGKDFVDGIENVYKKIKGSCSMLILTEDGIIVARDKWGRTPIVIGKKNGAYAATSESSSLPNLDYEIDRYVGPGELSVCVLTDWSSFANRMKICRFARSCGFIMAFRYLATKDVM